MNFARYFSKRRGQGVFLKWLETNLIFLVFIGRKYLTFSQIYDIIALHSKVTLLVSLATRTYLGQMAICNRQARYCRYLFILVLISSLVDNLDWGDWLKRYSL